MLRRRLGTEKAFTEWLNQTKTHSGKQTEQKNREKHLNYAGG